LVCHECGFLNYALYIPRKKIFQILNLKEIDKLNALASVLDKHREVSIQESIYRLLSLPMAKSSVKVKYPSTIHPHFRDGLRDWQQV